MQCPYIIQEYECDECLYCQIRPCQKGGLDNWNILERIDVN